MLPCTLMLSWLATMPVNEADFREWLGHPVTEWVLAQCGKFAAQQKDRWAALVWDQGEVDQALLNEARVRADCYLALSQSSLEDWKAIDDSEA